MVGSETDRYPMIRGLIGIGLFYFLLRGYSLRVIREQSREPSPPRTWLSQLLWSKPRTRRPHARSARSGRHESWSDDQERGKGTEGGAFDSRRLFHVTEFERRGRRRRHD